MKCMRYPVLFEYQLGTRYSSCLLVPVPWYSVIANAMYDPIQPENNLPLVSPLLTAYTFVAIFRPWFLRGTHLTTRPHVATLRIPLYLLEAR